MNWLRKFDDWLSSLGRGDHGENDQHLKSRSKNPNLEKEIEESIARKQAKLAEEMAKAKAEIPDILKRYEDEEREFTEGWNMVISRDGSFLRIEANGAVRVVNVTYQMKKLVLVEGRGADLLGTAFVTTYGVSEPFHHWYSDFGPFGYIHEYPRKAIPAKIIFDGVDMELDVPASLAQSVYDEIANEIARPNA